MNDIVILHLSDLHIDSSSPNYSRLLKGLIKDIKREITLVPDKSVVITVTGDIIHKGDKKAVPVAIRFFEDLYQVVKEKVVIIYIVPGNHDKFRTEENKFLIPAYRTIGLSGESKFNKEFFKAFWKYQEETYGDDKGSGYLELTKRIYEIFGITNIENRKYINNTFGVDVVEVLGKKYCFVMLNTGWSCIDEDDTRQLILGEFQIDEIKRQYHNLVDNLLDEGIELTLVLGHHPIGALLGKEEDRIFSEMISFEELNANAYLCGHTHDRTVINWVNNRHSINTFMTGIGWPENNSGYHIGAHTYSMYVFNIDANSIDIYVRSTDDGGDFSPDFRIYTNTEHKSNKKIIFPIKAEKAQTYISLGAGPERSSKAYYISDEFMKYIGEYVLRIGQFRQSAGMMIEGDKNELYDNIQCSDEYEEIVYGIETDGNETSSDEILYNYLFADIWTEKENEFVDMIINKIFSDCIDIRFNMFLGSLQRLCQKLQKILLYDKLQNGDIVRIHFRYLADRNSFLYLKLCVSFPEQIDPTDYDLSQIKYGDLIDAAYKTGKGLIYSVNKDFCSSKLKDKWTNFLTVVPLFDGNNYKRNYSESSHRDYPYITFGVTVNSDKFNPVLYCMDYFSINVMLEEIINTYIHIFKIDINKFCSWVQRELEKGDINE